MAELRVHDMSWTKRGANRMAKVIQLSRKGELGRLCHSRPAHEAATGRGRPRARPVDDHDAIQRLDRSVSSRAGRTPQLTTLGDRAVATYPWRLLTWDRLLLFDSVDTPKGECYYGNPCQCVDMLRILVLLNCLSASCRYKCVPSANLTTTSTESSKHRAPSASYDRTVR